MTTDAALRLNLDWDEIQVMVAIAASTPSKQIMGHHLVSGLRKQAPFLPPEQVVMELFTTALLIGDTNYSSPLNGVSAAGAVPSSSRSPLPP